MVKTKGARDPGIKDRLPFIFPFVTLRYERFGALLYNPYLGRDVELDQFEARFAGLCNGSISFPRIEKALKRQFGLTEEECDARLACALEKISEIFAIGSCEAKDRKHLKLPDTVDYSLYAPHLSAPREVTLEISYACNLRCPHCFTASGKPADGELNTGQALAVIDKLARAKVFSLLLSGGEPLLRPDILTLLCRLSTTNMRLDVGTNCVDIPKKVLKSLRRYRVSHAHVSIDGMGDRHDRFRGKKGAFDAACSTISALKKEHIGVSISTSVTSRNIDDLEDIIGLALDLGCKGFKAIPFFPVGRGRGKDSEMGLGPDEYYQLYRMLVGKERELKGKLTVDVETCFPFLFDEPQPERAQDGPMGCAAGNDTICIGSDGTIYPCPFLRDFPLGNITHGELVDVWNEAPILRMLRRLRKSDMLEPCRACEYAPKPCKGRCRAAAYLAHGDIRAADPTCFIHCGAFS